MATTAKEILIDARKLLEQYWCKGTMCKRDTFGNLVACCAMGALRLAAEEYGVEFTSPHGIAVEAIYKYVTPWGAIVSWNDDPQTSKEAVLKVFERAINETF